MRTQTRYILLPALLIFATSCGIGDDDAPICEVPGTTLAELSAYVPHANPQAEEMAIACGDGTLLADPVLADRIARDIDAIGQFDGRARLNEAPVSTIAVNSIGFQFPGDVSDTIQQPGFPWPCFHDALGATLQRVWYDEFPDTPYSFVFVSLDGIFNTPLLEEAYLETGASVVDTTGTT